jgi:3-deoxy-7-phosphoheptulonate synthase
MLADNNEAKSSMERAQGLPNIGAQAMDHRTPTSNVRVMDIKPMITPALLIEQFPMSNDVEHFVAKTRCEISDIVHGRDDRLLCVVGPCSVHDIEAGEEYGLLLKQLIDEFKDDLLVVMRVYFEKPRTTIGWKGLINDPELNGTFNINKGMKEGRKLLLRLLERNVAVGCEWLDTISPQYIADLVCWGAIGARTTESQVHRQLVSGLSMPVGFKNATSGDFDVAANSILSAKYEHVYNGITQ